MTDQLSASFDAISPAEMRSSRRIKWHVYGEGVLPCWVAEMDFTVAAGIRHAVAQTVEEGGLGYPRLPIDPALREAFVARQEQQHNWCPEPRRVFASVNVVQGLDAAILLHSQPGDGVLLLTPIYGPFHHAVDGTGRRRVESELVRNSNGQFEIDWDDLDEKLSAPDSAVRVFLLCSPHNPTGRVWRRDELERLSLLAERFDFVVVSDEIWADVTYSDAPAHIPFASVSPQAAARTITLSAATKAFNIAGLPMAIVAFGSDRLKRAHLTLPPHLTGHGGQLGNAATIAAWTQCQEWLDKVRSYLQANRDFALSFLREHLPQVAVSAPQGSYLAWLDCRKLPLPNGLEPHDFFLQRGIAFSPGLDFTSAGGGHVRLNFATSRQILNEILLRMTQSVDALGSEALLLGAQRLEESVRRRSPKPSREQ